LAGLSATKEGNSLKRGMPGWRRSADRTRLQANSLLKGILQGILRFRVSLDRFRNKKPLRCSHFSRNSLRKLTGKIFQRTGSFLQVSGNSGILSKRPFVHFSHTCFFDVRTRSVLSTNLKVRTTTCPTNFDPALIKASTSASASSMKVASFVEALEPPSSQRCAKPHRTR